MDKPREEQSFRELACYESLDIDTKIGVFFPPESNGCAGQTLPCGETPSEISKRLAIARETVPKAVVRFFGAPIEVSTEEPAHIPFYCHVHTPHNDSLVEYDLDEIDFHWLALVNESRKRNSQPAVSVQLFEFVIDRLEKFWHALTRDAQVKIQEQRLEEVPEDVPCAICGDADTSNSNVIVICDGCDLAVHQECYGVPFVPEGSWLCRRCMLNATDTSSCVLCPVKEGAMKQTAEGAWIHSVCAFWVDETYPMSDAYQEPIAGVPNIPKARWGLLCSVCHQRHGAPIQCSYKHCKVAYHSTCAKRSRYHMDHVKKISYCPRHATGSSAGTPKEEAADGIVDILSCDDRELEITQFAKKKQPHLRVKPLVNEFVFAQLQQSCAQVAMREKREFLLAAAKYWSLKREDRKGMPLLKRLQLELLSDQPPPLSKEQLEIEEERAASLLIVLRQLEQLETLYELIRLRERARMKWFIAQQKLILMRSTPTVFYLDRLLGSLKENDPREVFAEPVPLEAVPNYCEIIKSPMDFSTIKQKLSSFEYANIEEFSSDVMLMYENAQVFNRHTTIYYKEAVKQRDAAKPLIAAAAAAIATAKAAFKEKRGKIVFQDYPKASDFIADPPEQPVEDKKPKRVLPKKQPTASPEKITQKNTKKKRVSAQLEPLLIKNGTSIVWARIPGYPFYPGLLIGEEIYEKENVPKSLIRRIKGRKAKNFIVKFFDATDSWGIVQAVSIKKFSGDFDSDIKVLHKRKADKRQLEAIRTAFDLAVSFLTAAGS